MLRKIMSQEELDKKAQRNKMIIGIVLAIIMLFSTAGYFVMDFSSSKPQSIVFNNVKFTEGSGGWDFNFNNNAYQTLFNPS